MLSDSLKSVVKGDVQDDETTLRAFSKDASIFAIKPQVVVAPKDSEDIKALIKFINQDPTQHLSITPRSAGTCMSGGAINEGVVLDMLKYFNQVLFLGEDYVVTQPGVFYRDFEKKTLEKNLLLPCYTSSRELNTVGGMVGNNSAGEKTLQYGQTERYVKRLKMVCADGNEYEFKPITENEFMQKAQQDDFEGNLYYEIGKLIDENYDMIMRAKPITSKNSTGYGLWNVMHDQTFDMTKVIVGSQGTLGVVTEIEFHLVKPKPYTAMLEIELDSLDGLDQIVQEVLKFTPESFECFDDQTLIYATKFLGDVIKDFKKTPKWLAPFKLIPEIVESWEKKFPKLVLIAEFTAEDARTPMEQVHLCKNALARFNIKTRPVATNDEEKYWIIRRDSFNILRHHSAGTLRTAPFIDDICVPPSQLPQFLPQLRTTLDPYSDKLTYTIAGHIGNGNFHIIPLMDLTREDVRQVIPELSQKIFSLVHQFHGTMAAEHNDGMSRGMYLPLMYGEEVYQLFKKVKETFDPNNIFNPHKKTDANEQFSLNHIDKNYAAKEAIEDYKDVKSGPATSQPTPDPAKPVVYTNNPS